MKINEMQEQIFKCIELYLRKYLVNNGKTNYFCEALILNKNIDGTYKVRINNQEYDNVKSRTGMSFQIGDRVDILVRNGDFSRKVIQDYIIE